MDTQNKLPFLIEQHVIKKWLVTIESQQPVQATNELYNVLKVLLKHPTEFQNQLTTVLPLVTPVITQLCQQLEHLFCTSAKNIDNKKRKIARLSINTLRYLVILNQNSSLSIDTNTKLAQNYNDCLQICYLCLKQCVLIYERPSSELWKIIGDIYQSAIDKHLLDLTIKGSIASINHQYFISDSIKSILLLSLCKPYHLTQLEILRLSDLLEQHHDKVCLSDQQSTYCTHCWNYNSSQAVQVLTPNTHFGFSTLFIDNHSLVQTLIDEGFSSIAELLTGSQSLIPQLTKVQPFRKKISTSFACIISILEEYRQNEKINKTSVHALAISETFELQSLDYGHTSKNSANSNDTSGQGNMPCLMTEASVKQDANMDFMLIELTPHECHVEDLILILDKQQKPQLGIIRNISILKDNHYQLIVEKICTEVELVTLKHQNGEKKALLCTVYADTTFLIVSPGKFTTGSHIKIDTQLYTLTRLYESTAYFMLYQIKLID